MISFLLETQEPDPPLFSVSAPYGFISFAWKALLLTLIVQKWQPRIIAPVVIAIIKTGYAIHDDRERSYYYLVRCATQLFHPVLVIYCEDKIKWKMIWINLEQKNWMQANNFILNNILENIMILDVKVEVRFINDYCKNLRQKSQDPSLSTKDFLKKIRDFKQDDELNLQEKRLTTEKEFLPENRKSLGELITNFNKIFINFEKFYNMLSKFKYDLKMCEFLSK